MASLISLIMLLALVVILVIRVNVVETGDVFLKRGGARRPTPPAQRR